MRTSAIDHFLILKKYFFPINTSDFCFISFSFFGVFLIFKSKQTRMQWHINTIMLNQYLKTNGGTKEDLNKIINLPKSNEKYFSNSKLFQEIQSIFHLKYNLKKTVASFASAYFIINIINGEIFTILQLIFYNQILLGFLFLC